MYYVSIERHKRSQTLITNLWICWNTKAGLGKYDGSDMHYEPLKIQGGSHYDIKNWRERESYIFFFVLFRLFRFWTLLVNKL